MKTPIINIDKLKYRKMSNKKRVELEFGSISTEIGSRKLGYNITVVPPGKRAFPYHAHRGNEEMFFVLEGEGSIRINGKSHKIRKGDFISLPPGRNSAHQVVNDSKAPIRYLAVSTMETPEVVEYPDSGKLGVLAGEHPLRPPSEDTIRHFTHVKDKVDYWEGEE